MSILSGFKKYKDYILTSSGYQLSSRWTKSDAVVMGDGTDDTNTLEKNLGSIQGITDSLTATSSNVALSAAGGNNLQSQIDTLNSNLIKIKPFSNISTGADSLAAIPIDTSVYNIINVVSSSCYVGSIMIGIGVVSVRCESWSGESLPNTNGLNFWILCI